MADFYVDHENTALYPSAYMSTPASSASLPQDGDGMATGAITPAVSSASWNLTSASASAGTMTVMGASITGLTGSGSALATAIATAINTSTAGVTAAKGNIANLYLKALVWATSSGAVLTVYSRIASAGLNYSAGNTACQMAAGTGWTSPPANAQFSGGVSGPFRYLFNTTALASAVASGVSGAVGTYGAMPATAMGNVAAGDIVHIRTKRGGVDVVLTWPTTSINVTSRAVGTFSKPLTFLADYGTKWPGDVGVFIMRADASATASRSLIIAAAGIKQVWAGVNLTATTRNWRHELINVPQIANHRYTIGSGATAVHAIEIIGHEITGASGGPMNNANSAYQYFQFAPPAAPSAIRDYPLMLITDLVFRSAGRTSPFFGGSSSAYFASVKAVNCVMDHSGCTLPSEEAIVSIYTACSWRFEAVGCKWLNFPAAANQSGVQKYAARQVTVILRDCSFDNIKIFGGPANGGLVGTAEDGSNSNTDILRSIQVVSTLGNRPIIFETARKAFGWFDSAAPKTSASTLPDGTTTFSLRTTVTSEAGNVNKSAPVLFPRLSKINSLGDGDRIGKLRILVDDNIIAELGGYPKNDELFVNVTYVGTDGDLRTVTTKPWITSAPATLQLGVSADWTATNYDVNGVSHNYTAFEISFSLPGLKGGSELGLEFVWAIQSTSVDNYVFLDPEWALI